MNFFQWFCLNAGLVILNLHSLRLQKKIFWSCAIILHLIISLNFNHSDILRQRTQDVELKKYCVTLLEKFGSLSYTRDILEELDTILRTEVAKLGGNPLLEDILDDQPNWKKWTDEKNPEKWGPFVATSNVSTVHVWLVANSYLLLLLYWLLRTWQKLWENKLKYLCSMGIVCGAYYMHYLLLNVILFVSEKYVLDPERFASGLHHNILFSLNV